MKMVFVILLFLGLAFGQTDPGPRGGAPGAGSYYPTLSSKMQTLFDQAKDQFSEVEAVVNGLGPGFNGTSCAGCHAEPAIGGSSPGLNSRINPQENPQIGFASAFGASNILPPFIRADGPVREARFIRNSDDSLDGGVHDLFSIAGRTDALGCNLPQPDFAAAIAQRNIIARIPTPLFGLGLVEFTSDETLEANLASNSSWKSHLGIHGRFNHRDEDAGSGPTFNRSGNDGTITRFGWKAQNKSLMIFSAEAYNVEMGVTNELFPQERNASPGCLFNATPEDGADLTNTGNILDVGGDVINFAMFERLLAPPTPAPEDDSAKNGERLFSTVGCALCHSPTLTTGNARYSAMANVEYHPYSDFALHYMGTNLADGVTQGAAGPYEFRTAPLWGVGQRLFFLHDGRTTDLLDAIEEHASSGSEANIVIRRFNRLTEQQQQDILNFLRSL